MECKNFSKYWLTEFSPVTAKAEKKIRDQDRKSQVPGN